MKSSPAIWSLLNADNFILVQVRPETQKRLFSRAKWYFKYGHRTLRAAIRLGGLMSKLNTYVQYVQIVCTVHALVLHTVCVSHPGKGGCADPVNEDAILERVGGRPPGRNRKRQLASDTGDGKTWISVKWRDDRKIRKTTPSRLRVTSMHRVS